MCRTCVYLFLASAALGAVQHRNRQNIPQLFRAGRHGIFGKLYPFRKLESRNRRFVVRNGKIYAERTVYAAFGAGVESTLAPGETLSYDENGNMVVSGFGTVFPEVKYIVGTVYDHVLVIRGETISLTALCGRNAHVAFRLA